MSVKKSVDRRILILLFFTFHITACSTTPSAEPTATGFLVSPTFQEPTYTLQHNSTVVTKPSATPLLSPTEKPTIEPETTSMVTLPLPEGQPVASWKGVPIMPEAIAGEEKEDGYSYTIKATVEQVQDFYESEMPKLGWKPFAIGKGETGSLLLMYQKEGKTTTVSVFTQGEVTLLLIVQF